MSRSGFGVWLWSQSLLFTWARNLRSTLRGWRGCPMLCQLWQPQWPLGHRGQGHGTSGVQRSPFAGASGGWRQLRCRLSSRMQGFGCCPGLQELPALLPLGYLQRIISRSMGRCRCGLPWPCRRAGADATQPLPCPDKTRHVLLHEVHLS